MNRFTSSWAIARLGSIASRNGSATQTPAPRRMVRRDNGRKGMVDLYVGCSGGLLGNGRATQAERGVFDESEQQAGETALAADELFGGMLDGAGVLTGGVATVRVQEHTARKTG